MMASGLDLDALRALNQTEAFNRWCGLTIERASPGAVELSMPWRPEMGQYAGFLHAGLIGALIDTACGYAAGMLAGRNLLASHFSVNCLRPAVGSLFVARARVVKPGRTQLFTACDLFACSDRGEVLVADGQTLLTVVSS